MKLVSMARKRKKLSKFLLAAPIVILGALLVLYKSAQKPGFLVSGCRTLGYSGEYDTGDVVAVYDGEEYISPKLAEAPYDSNVLGVASPEERWVEVDLSEQKLRAWDGDVLYLETPVSTGLPWWPTPRGEFRVWIKLKYTKMEGGEGRYYYNLPNVPYVMFFEGEGAPAFLGYGLHGTYWHNDFGTQRSHGCVNLPTSIAEKLFYWTTPTIAEGKWAARATDSNPGTRIVIHE